MSLEKVEKIGYGVYSKIYKVRDEDGEEHAMKICLKSDGYNFGVSYKEADVALKFDHPYIVCLRATFQGNPFPDCESPTSPLDETHKRMSHDVNHLLYELANDSLDEYFSTTRINIRVLISILSDVLLGLEYMHLSGYVHRDVRADNILLFYVDCETCENCEKGEKCKNQSLVAKVSDFGFTRLYLKNDPLTPRINNVNYRAPECLMGRTDYSQNIDIWSIGCMVYVLLQRKHMVEDPISYTDKSFLGYFSQILPYEFPTFVKRKYGITAQGKTFEEFFPISEKMEREINSVSTVKDFKDFFLGTLEFDPKKRLTATKCLDMPFFDSVRQKIVDTRSAYPPLPRENPILKIHDCVERKWIMGNFRALYQNRNKQDKEEWYTHRIMFLALSLFDDAINYLSKFQNKHIVPTEIMGKILTKRQADLIYIVCLYFSIKYMSGTESPILSFQEVYPNLRYTEEEFRYAKNFEVKLFTEILGQKIYRPTLYDLLIDEKIPREKEVLSLLVYYINAHYKGKTLEEAYSYWKKYIDHYTPK